MLSRELNPGLGRAGRVKPQLECLEDRCCPSTLTSLSTPLLHLTDDPSGSVISIRDDGRGNVQVTTDGSSASYHRVQSIDFESRGGSDQISYTLTNTLTQPEKLKFNLGEGSSQLRLDLSKGISFATPKPKAALAQVGIEVDGGNAARGVAHNVNGSDDDVFIVLGAAANPQRHLAAADLTNVNLSVNTNLGDGWDHVNAQINGDLAGSSNVNINVTGGGGINGATVQGHGAIEVNASLGVTVADKGACGGAFHVDYSGKLTGHLSIQETAGKGWDILESKIDLAGGSNGWLTDHEVDGPNHDNLSLKVNNAGSLKGLTGLISNVNNKAAITHTSNVKVS